MITAAHPSISLPRGDPDVPSEPIFRLSVNQYHEMIRAGILTSEDRVELLEGWLLKKMSKNPPHSTITGVVAESLRTVLPAGWCIRIQEPFTTELSEPEPDICVVQGALRNYLHEHPRPEHIALLVEVADTILSRDRGIKRHIYAETGVPVYWIVDVNDRRIECFTLPTGPVKEPAYQSVQYFTEEETIPLLIAGREAGRIAVRDILP